MDRELLLERFGPAITIAKRYWPLAVGAVFIVIFIVSLTMCITGGRTAAPIHRTATPSSFTLRSMMFRDGNTLPTLYTAQGRNVSPALEFLALPPDTRELALIADDPGDASVVYWVVYRIPASLPALAEAISTEPTPPLLAGGVQGRNSNGTLGYHGPDTTDGNRRIRFTLYALSEPLESAIPSELSAADLRPHLDRRTIKTTTLTATARR